MQLPLLLSAKGNPPPPALPSGCPNHCSRCQMSSNTKKRNRLDGFTLTYKKETHIEKVMKVKLTICQPLSPFPRCISTTYNNSNSGIQTGNLREACRLFYPNTKLFKWDLYLHVFSFYHKIQYCVMYYLGNVGPWGLEGVPSRCGPQVSCPCPSSGRSEGHRAFPSHACLPWAAGNTQESSMKQTLKWGWNIYFTGDSRATYVKSYIV